MQIGNIVRFGVFNSKNRILEITKTSRIASTFELEYVISSSAVTQMDGIRREIAPDSFILAKPNQARKTLSNFKCYYIHLDIPKENEFFDVFSNLPDYTLLINKEQCKSTMKALISHLLMYGYNPECEFINAKLLELLWYLKSNLTQNKMYTDISVKCNNDFLPQVIDYINENYSHKITLQSLSEYVGYSPNYFHSIFSTIMGITPQNYITTIRISKAKYKLSTSSKSIVDIACECGFSSQSHISAAFKKYTTMTPNEYRKLCNLNYFQ